jgi:acyl dehydratase
MEEKATVLSILKQQIGRQATYTDEFVVEKGMIERFAIAIGDPDPLYRDEAFAASTRHDGIIAPPTFLFEWNHHKHSIMSPEIRKSLFAGLERLPRLLRGVNEYEFINPVRPGDVITTTSRVSDVYEKKGKSGQLIFMICSTDYFNQKEEVLGRSLDTYILLP